MKVPDNVAGKKIRCPSCSGVVDVPQTADTGPGTGPSSAAASTSTTEAGSSENRPAVRKARPVSSDSYNTSAAPPARPATPSNRPAAVRPAATSSDARTSTPGKGKASEGRTSPAQKPKKRPPLEDDENLYEDSSDSFGSYDDNYEEGYDSFGANPFAPPKMRSNSSRGGSTSANEAASRNLAGLGLLIQGWATVSIFLIILFVIGVSFVMRLSSGSTIGPPPIFLAILGLSGIGMMIAGITVLIGECICLAIPERSGAKAFIIAAISLLSFQVILGITQAVTGANTGAAGFQPTPFQTSQSGTQFVFAMLGLLAGIGHIVCFELFLRKASQYARRDDLAKQAMTVLIGIPSCMGTVFVCSLLGPLLGRFVAPILALILLIPILAATIAVIVFSVMHVALLFKVGRALRRG